MITKQKNILLVTSEFPPQPGGIGNHAYNLAKQLQLNNFSVDVIADMRSFSGEKEKVFDAELKFRIHRVSREKLRVFMYLKRIIILLKLIKTSEIIIASGKFSLWIVAFSSLFYNRKYIAIIHGSEVNYNSKHLKNSINYSLKRFSKLIAVSNYTKSLVSLKFRNKVVVIHNGISVSNWNLEVHKNLILRTQPSLITVGNVTDRKGQLNVIKMLPKLIELYPKLHYHCVGIPTKKEDFLRVAQELQVEKHITFHGQLSEKKLQRQLQSSGVFVMLSNTTNDGDVEGFGIAIIEANVLGLPAIGSVDCGIEDAINNNKSGILVPSNNPELFISALKKILNQYDYFSSQAKKWALQHSWDIIIKQYIREIKA